MKTEKLWWLLPLGAAGAGVATLALLNLQTSAQTSADAADARLKTRRYNDSLDTVRLALEELVPTLRCYGAHWRMIDVESYDASTPGASVVLRVEVPVALFVDEMTITLRGDGEANTLVDVRSQARLAGKSDFGENRRHVIQLLSALDEKFAPA
jgi:hypothetical protein